MSLQNEIQCLRVHLTKTLIAYDMSDIVIGIEGSKDPRYLFNLKMFPGQW